jgi:hypothetical protein
MPAVGTLLNMERCESCDRDLAPTWKFCIHCGRPVRRTADAPLTSIPAAIRPDGAEPNARRYDAPFWIGVGMAVLGLALIVYAAVQIYSTYA